MKAIRGVLLDVDGTLIDSNDAHARSWVEALAEQHIEVSFEKVRRLIGKGGDKLLPEVTGIETDSAEGEEISKRRGEIFQEKYLPKLKPFPQARELLQRMKDHGLRLSVATSAKKNELKGLLQVCGANELVDAKTTSDDAENSKPDPDIIHAAMKQLGLPAEQVLMLGDTPYDVESATRAGVATVALRCGGWGDSDLKGAVAIYDSPADLLARFTSSPFHG